MANPSPPKTIYDFSVNDINNNKNALADYKGKVLLIVNTASQCGFTPQYEGLQKIYTELKDQGFEILGFPCDQFGGQEPGSNEQIAEFCTTKFHVTFPMFAKIDVNGSNADPLYSFLKESNPGLLGTEAIKWNFTKFLIDRQGNPIARFASVTKPEDIRDAIKEALSKY